MLFRWSIYILALFFPLLYTINNSAALYANGRTVSPSSSDLTYYYFMVKLINMST